MPSLLKYKRAKTSKSADGAVRQNTHDEAYIFIIENGETGSNMLSLDNSSCIFLCYNCLVMSDTVNIPHIQKGHSPEEITKKGQEIYLSELKDQLEQKKLGEYAVIDVDSKEYFVNKDLVVALDEARKTYPNKLFFIVQIGTLSPSMRTKKQQYAWLF